MRRKTGRFLIDGAREVTRAIVGGIEFDEAYICPDLCTTPERQEAAHQARDAAQQTILVAPDVFARLAFGDRAEGTIVVAKAPARTLDDLKLPERSLVAVVERIEKPGNFGAVLRSADAAGVSAVIAADSGHDLFNPNAIRASLGAIFTLPVRAADSESVFQWLHSRSLSIYAARVGAEQVYTEADFVRSAAVVLGSEDQGLSSLWQRPDITGIKLPMLGVSDSLNISVAAAVVFYEAWRQRTGAGLAPCLR